jgi:hypothetical protein
MTGVPPTLANGKICYLEIPADDIAASAAFYESVFSWSIRRRGDGEIAFDDTVGGVSGTWVTGRVPQPEEGITVHVMVENVDSTLERVREHGGEIVKPRVELGENEAYALFRDPVGNALGVYQDQTLAAGSST